MSRISVPPKLPRLPCKSVPGFFAATEFDVHIKAYTSKVIARNRNSRRRGIHTGVSRCLRTTLVRCRIYVARGRHNQFHPFRTFRLRQGSARSPHIQSHRKYTDHKAATLSSQNIAAQDVRLRRAPSRAIRSTSSVPHAVESETPQHTKRNLSWQLLRAWIETTTISKV